MIFSKTKTTIDPPDSTLVNDFSDTNHGPAAKRAISDTMDFSGSGGGQASGGFPGASGRPGVGDVRSKIWREP